MTSFNELSPAQAERLAKLAEECGEVVQAVGKILRHGYESAHPDGRGPTNRENLESEIADVLREMDCMVGTRDINAAEIHSQRCSPYREQRRNKYMHHQGKS